MLDYLLQEPDAAALTLLLLLLWGALLLGCAAAIRRDRDERLGLTPALTMVTTWPHLLRRELMAALAALLAVSWWAILVEVPLGPLADPSVTPTVAKAPWFFVGIQEQLQYFDAWLAGAVLPLLTIVGLAALPYLDTNPEGNGRYSLRHRPVALLILAALLVIWLLPMIVGEFARGEQWALQAAWRPPALEPSPPQPPRTLGQLLGWSPRAACLAGALLCLGPFLALLPLGWALRRRYVAVARMGRWRFAIAGVLLIAMAGVVVKVVLLLALGVRYLWVTPWFRI